MKKILSLMLAFVMTLSVIVTGDIMTVRADDPPVNVVTDAGNMATIVKSAGTVITESLTGDSFNVSFEGSLSYGAVFNPYFPNFTMYVPKHIQLNDFVMDNRYVVNPEAVPIPWGNVPIAIVQEFAATAGLTAVEAVTMYPTWYAYELDCAPQEERDNLERGLTTGIAQIFNISTSFKKGETPNDMEAFFWMYMDGLVAGEALSNGEYVEKKAKAVANLGKIISSAETVYGATKQVLTPSGALVDDATLNSEIGLSDAFKSELAGYGVTLTENTHQYVTYRIQVGPQRDGHFMYDETMPNGFINLMSATLSVMDTFGSAGTPAEVVAVVRKDSGGDVPIDLTGKISGDALLLTAVDLTLTDGNTYMPVNTFDIVVRYEKAAYETTDSFAVAQASPDYINDPGLRYRLSDTAGAIAKKFTVENAVGIAYQTMIDSSVQVAGDVTSAKFGFSVPKPDSFTVTVTKMIEYVENGETKTVPYAGETLLDRFPVDPAAGAGANDVIAFELLADGVRAKTITGEDVPVMYTTRTSAMVTFEDVEYKSGVVYSVRELNSVQDWPKAADVTLTGVASGATVAETVTNTLGYGYGMVAFKKMNNLKKDEPVAGVQFDFVQVTDVPEMKSATSGADGYVYVVLPVGTYRVEENAASAAAAGFEAIDSDEYIQVTANTITYVATVVDQMTSDGITSLEDAVVYNNPTDEGMVLVQKKVSQDGGATSTLHTSAAPFTFRVHPVEDATATALGLVGQVAAGKSGLTYGDLGKTQQQFKNLAAADTGEKTALSYDGEAEGFSKPLEKGWYWVVETITANADQYDEPIPMLVYVDSYAGAKGEPSVINFVNNTRARDVYVVKQGSDGGVMTGAEFQLYKKNESTGNFEAVSPAQTFIVGAAESGEYRIKFQLPYDTDVSQYALVETKAPADYLLPSATHPGYITVLEDAGGNLNQGNYLPVQLGTITNDKVVEVKVQKYRMNNGTPTETGLAGANFTLQDENGIYYRKNGTQTTAATNNGSGTVANSTSNVKLASGLKYTFEEKSVPAGYMGSPIVVVTDKDNNVVAKDAGGQYTFDAAAGPYDIKFYNEPYKELRITKQMIDQNGYNIGVDASDLAAIELTLVPKSVADAAVGSVVDAADVITLGASDHDGRKSGYYTANTLGTKEAFSNEEGYYVLETAGITGYRYEGAMGAAEKTFVIDGETFTGYYVPFNAVSTETSESNAIVTNVTIRNEASMGRIRVFKAGYNEGADHTLVNGQAGSALNGEFEVYELVDGKLKYVTTLYTGTEQYNGGAENSALTEKLPAGTYYLKEVKAPIGMLLDPDKAYYENVANPELGIPGASGNVASDGLTLTGPDGAPMSGLVPVMVDEDGDELDDDISVVEFYNQFATSGGGEIRFLQISLLKYAIGSDGKLKPLNGLAFDLVRKSDGDSQVLVSGTANEAGYATSKAFEVRLDDQGAAPDTATAIEFSLKEQPGKNVFVSDPTEYTIEITWGQLKEYFAANPGDVYHDTHFVEYPLINEQAWGKLKFSKTYNSAATPAFAEASFILVKEGDIAVNFDETDIDGGVAVPGLVYKGQTVTGFRPTNNGDVTLTVAPGYYQAIEISAASGYLNSNETVKTEAGSWKSVGAFWSAMEDDVVTTPIGLINKIELSNDPLPKIQVIKKKGTTNENLAGAQFAIYAENEITINGDGGVRYTIADDAVPQAKTSAASGIAAFTYPAAAPKKVSDFAGKPEHVFYIVESGLAAGSAADLVTYKNEVEPPIVKVTLTLNAASTAVVATFENAVYSTTNLGEIESWAAATKAGDSVIVRNPQKLYVEVLKKDLNMGNVLELSKDAITFKVYKSTTFTAENLVATEVTTGGRTEIYLPATKVGEFYYLVEDSRAGAESGNYEADPYMFKTAEFTTSLGNSIVAAANVDDLDSVLTDITGADAEVITVGDQKVLKFKVTYGDLDPEVSYTFLNIYDKGVLRLSKAAQQAVEGTTPYYLTDAVFTAIKVNNEGDSPAVGAETHEITVERQVKPGESVHDYRIVSIGDSTPMTPGWYQIKETKAPDGFEKSSATYYAYVYPRTVSTVVRTGESTIWEGTGINGENESGEVFGTMPEKPAVIKNAPQFGLFMIDKQEAGAPGTVITAAQLQAAEFIITPKDGQELPNGKATMSTKEDSIWFVFEDNKIYSPILPMGEYEVKEVTAPSAYTLNPELYDVAEGVDPFVKTVTVSATTKIQADNTVTFENVPKLANMNPGIKKTVRVNDPIGTDTEAKALVDGEVSMKFTINGLAYNKGVGQENEPYVLTVKDFTVFDGLGTATNAASAEVANGMKVEAATGYNTYSESPAITQDSYHITSMNIGAASIAGSSEVVKALVTLNRRSGAVDSESYVLSNSSSTLVSWSDLAGRDDDVIGFKVEYFVGTHAASGNEIPAGFTPSDITYNATFYQDTVDVSRYEIGRVTNTAVLRYTFTSAASHTSTPGEVVVAEPASAAATFDNHAKQKPEMRLEKSFTNAGTTSVVAKSSISFTLKLTNTSAAPAGSLVIIDDLPLQLERSSSVVPVLKKGAVTLTSDQYEMIEDGNRIYWKLDDDIVLNQNEFIEVVFTARGTDLILSTLSLTNNAYAMTYERNLETKYFEDGHPWNKAPGAGFTQNKFDDADFDDVLSALGYGGYDNIFNSRLHATLPLEARISQDTAARKFVKNDVPGAEYGSSALVTEDGYAHYKLALLSGDLAKKSNLRFGDVFPYVNDTQLDATSSARLTRWAEGMLPTLAEEIVLMETLPDQSVREYPNYTVYYCIGAPDGTNWSQEVFNALMVADSNTTGTAGTATKTYLDGRPAYWTDDYDAAVAGGEKIYGFIVVLDDGEIWEQNLLTVEYTMNIPSIDEAGLEDYYASLHTMATSDLRAQYYSDSARPLKVAPVAITIRPTEAELGDMVWHDMNYDGMQDADETGVQGVSVTLHEYKVNVELLKTVAAANGLAENDLDAMDDEAKAEFYAAIEAALAANNTTAVRHTVGKTVITNADGEYTFGGLTPYQYATGVNEHGNVVEKIGSNSYITLYKVQFDITGNTEYTGFTSPNAGDDISKDSDALTDGFSDFVYILPGLDNTKGVNDTVDAGLLQHRAIVVEKTIEDSSAIGFDPDAAWRSGGDMSAYEGYAWVAGGAGRSFDVVLQKVKTDGTLGAPIQKTITPDSGEALFVMLEFGRYVIREVNVSADFTPVWTGTTGNIVIDGLSYPTITIGKDSADEVAIGLTNRAKNGSGSITVDKTVLEKGKVITDWGTAEFTMELHRFDEDLDEYVFEDSIVLSATKKSHVFEGLGLGIYKVVETDGHNGFNVTYSNGTAGKPIVLDATNATAAVTVTNTAKSGKIRVTKEYFINGEDQKEIEWDEEFTIKIIQTDASDAVVATLVFDEPDEKLVYLDPGTYKIEEVISGAFTPTYFIDGDEENTFTIEAGSDETLLAKVVNNKTLSMKGDVKITKAYNYKGTMQDKWTETFKIQILTELGQVVGEVTPGNTDAQWIKDVPVGTYTINEVNGDKYDVQILINGKKTDTFKIERGISEAIVVQVTNTAQIGDVSVEKVYQDGEGMEIGWHGKTFDIEIVDSEGTVQKTVTLSEATPKLVATMPVGTYTIREKNGAAYNPVYSIDDEEGVVAFTIEAGKSKVFAAKVVNTEPVSEVSVSKVFMLGGKPQTLWLNNSFVIQILDNEGALVKEMTFTEPVAQTLILPAGKYTFVEIGGESFNPKYFVNDAEGSTFVVPHNESTTFDLKVENTGKVPPVTPGPTTPPVASPIPSPTASPLASPSPSPSPSEEATETPAPSEEATPTPSAEATETPTPSEPVVTPEPSEPTATSTPPVATQPPYIPPTIPGTGIEKEVVTENGDTETWVLERIDEDTFLVFNEDGNPLGTIKVPADKMLDDINILDELIPLGMIDYKPNPATSGASTKPFNVPFVMILLAFAASVRAKKRWEKEDMEA